MKFNDKLLELRKKAGLSQEELGDKIDVSRQTISKWEVGKSTPELDKLVALSEIFNVSLDELVKDIEIPKESISKKKKINKYILIVVWMVICLFLAFILYRYLSFRYVLNKYGEFLEEAKKNGGMVTIMKSVDSKILQDNAFINHYFKGNIEYIQYYRLQEGESGPTYLYKTEYRDKENVYLIDEVNKTYTVKNRISYTDNGALDEIECKINSNLLLNSVYTKFPVLKMVFRKEYHTSFEPLTWIRVGERGTIAIRKKRFCRWKRQVSFIN